MPYLYGLTNEALQKASRITITPNIFISNVPRSNPSWTETMCL